MGNRAILLGGFLFVFLNAAEINTQLNLFPKGRHNKIKTTHSRLVRVAGRVRK
jgi:hypothetical protein